MKSIYAAGLVILMCIMAGCKERVKPVRLENCNDLKADNPKIIEFANKCANTDGTIDLTTYEQPKVSEESTEWDIFYAGKASIDGRMALGHHFTIIIDRKTCECKVYGGR
ncbi:MAG: hypothetical protein KJ760_19200 [Proteobacteria bacterium]|nr:hypothetical protein [Pseudomonadota bacterium]